LALIVLDSSPMKTLLIVTIASVVLISLPTQSRAADEDSGPPGQTKKGVPPGLQKKGGLPPGQAKKRASQNDTEEKSPTSTPTTPTPSVNAPPSGTGTVSTPSSTPGQSGSANPASGAGSSTAVTPNSGQSSDSGRQYSKETLERRALLNTRVEDLDAMGRHSEVRDRVFARMYRGSGVPISALEAQEKAYPDMGVGGIMIANTIAKHGRIPVEQVYAEHKAGKSWGEIANQHKVSVADLLEKTSDYTAAARDAERDASKQSTRVTPALGQPTPIKVLAREPERPAVTVNTPTVPTPPVVPQTPTVTLPKAPSVNVATVTSTPQPATQQYSKEVLERRALLNKRVEDLDAMGRHPEVRDRVFARLYRRADIPITVLESQEKAHPEAGVGGMLIANSIAKLGRIPVEQVYSEHKAGTSWGEIANERKVSVADLLEKVSDYNAAARDAERDAVKGR
jgi:hypothetical protein